MAGPGKPGRPSKGKRERRTLLLPESLVPLVKEHAARLGTDVNDFIVRTLADRVDGTPPVAHCEPLPMARREVMDAVDAERPG